MSIPAAQKVAEILPGDLNRHEIAGQTWSAPSSDSPASSPFSVSRIIHLHRDQRRSLEVFDMRDKLKTDKAGELNITRRIHPAQSPDETTALDLFRMMHGPIKDGVDWNSHSPESRHCSIISDVTSRPPLGYAERHAVLKVLVSLPLLPETNRTLPFEKSQTRPQSTGSSSASGALSRSNSRNGPREVPCNASARDTRRGLKASGRTELIEPLIPESCNKERLTSDSSRRNVECDLSSYVSSSSSLPAELNTEGMQESSLLEEGLAGNWPPEDYHDPVSVLDELVASEDQVSSDVEHEDTKTLIIPSPAPQIAWIPSECNFLLRLQLRVVATQNNKSISDSALRLIGPFWGHRSICLKLDKTKVHLIRANDEDPDGCRRYGTVIGVEITACYFTLAIRLNRQPDYARRYLRLLLDALDLWEQFDYEPQQFVAFLNTQGVADILRWSCRLFKSRRCLNLAEAAAEARGSLVDVYKPILESPVSSKNSKEYRYSACGFTRFICKAIGHVSVGFCRTTYRFVSLIREALSYSATEFCMEDLSCVASDLAVMRDTIGFQRNF